VCDGQLGIWALCLHGNPSEHDEGLALDYTLMGFLGTGNLGGYLLFALVGGFLSVRYGPRLVISASLLFMGVCLFLTGFAKSFSFAMAMRFMTGLGSGGAYVPMMGLLAAWFTAEKRGMASGIISTGASFSMILMGLLMNSLDHRFLDSGWRVAWQTIGISSVGVGILCSFFLANRPQDKGLKSIGKPKGDPVLKMPGQLGRTSIVKDPFTFSLQSILCLAFPTSSTFSITRLI
jgi:sugar phosphate permease